VHRPITAPTGPHTPAGHRHLRAVRTDHRAPGQLVAYVVLAPEHARISDLFAPGLTVHRLETPLPETLEAEAPRPDTPLPDTPQPPSEPAPGLHIDPDRHTASLDGRPLDLTYLEFELLAHLVAHPYRVHTRAHLMAVVWGYDHPGDGRTIDVHIARLRRKLGPAHRDSIATVRRVGYKYVPTVG